MPAAGPGRRRGRFSAGRHGFALRPKAAIRASISRGELKKGHRPLRRRVEDESRQAVAGRLGQTDVARDDGVEDLVAEVSLELLADLCLQGDAGIEHHAQDADHLERRVDVGVDLLDGVDQVGQAFEGEILALHRHDHAMRARQAIQRKQAQAGRAIDQGDVVLGADRGQRCAEPLFAPLHVHQLHFGTGQLTIGADHVVAAAGAAASGLGNGGGLEQQVIDARLKLTLVDARAHGGIALGVEIDEQNPAAEACKARGEIDGGGRLADATLLVGNAEGPHLLVYWESQR